MASHGHYGETADIRYVRQPGDAPDQGEWYRRCEDCRKAERQCWWPLTLEFWNPRTMQRCRACDSARKNRLSREAHRADPAYNQRRSAEYSRTHRRQINLKVRERRARRREQNDRAA